MKRLILIIGVLVIVAGGFLLLKNESTDIKNINVQKKDNKTGNTTGSVNKGEVVADITAQAGLSVRLFAEDIEKPRDLEFTPGGTLLVSNPSRSQVVALPDRNKDGVADENRIALQGEGGIHGLAFYKGKLYVAEVERVSRYSWNEENLTAEFEDEIMSLPQGGNHSSRTIVFDNNDNVYVSVGSTCNVCVEKDGISGSVLTAKSSGEGKRIFARGMRNAPFLIKHPATGDIWVTEMGRDNLGDNIPPDEINILKNNGDYGWPYCYGNKIYDKNFGQKDANYCQNTLPPIYEVPAHSAPLGLTFISSNSFTKEEQGDLLVSYHGSWNRSEPTGYKVVKLNVDGNQITGSEDFLTGFTKGSEIIGRPVDVLFDKEGILFVSDDRAGKVYAVTK